MSAFLDKRVKQQTEQVQQMVAEFPEAKYAVTGLIACVQDAERERIIELISSNDFYSVIAFHIYGNGSTVGFLDDLTKMIRGEQDNG